MIGAISVRFWGRRWAGSFNQSLNVAAMLAKSFVVNLAVCVNRLKKLHYVCLFYDKYYELSASGVLMDSIACGKPIIGTKLPILKTIEQRFGDIGYLCRKNEFSKTIGSIIKKNDSGRYRRQVFNMSKVKASRTPEKLATKYLRLVNDL